MADFFSENICKYRVAQYTLLIIFGTRSGRAVKVRRKPEFGSGRRAETGKTKVKSALEFDR